MATTAHITCPCALNVPYNLQHQFWTFCCDKIAVKRENILRRWTNADFAYFVGIPYLFIRSAGWFWNCHIALWYFVMYSCIEAALFSIPYSPELIAVEYMLLQLKSLFDDVLIIYSSTTTGTKSAMIHCSMLRSRKACDILKS